VYYRSFAAITSDQKVQLEILKTLDEINEKLDKLNTQQIQIIEPVEEVTIVPEIEITKRGRKHKEVK
jgi:hypothetical protein